MKTAESEIPDAHFTVDKQNISLWPRGKHQSLLRTHSMLSASTRICWSFNKCLLLPTEPPPKMSSSPVLRKPCTVRAAFVILTLVLLASVVLQAILCKSAGFITWASSSPGPVSFRTPSPLFPALQWSLPLWLFHLPRFICLFPCAFTGPCPQ